VGRPRFSRTGRHATCCLAGILRGTTDAGYRKVLARVWAKSARAGASEGEGLLDHTAAVVARLGDLHRRFPGLAARVGDPRLWHRAFWACAMHDLGKVAPGFQAQLTGGARPWGHRHEVLSLAFLEWALPGEDHDDRAWVAAGIASHHRDLDEIATLYPAPDDPEDDPIVRLVVQVADDVVEALAAWLAEEPPLWVERQGLPGVETGPPPVVDPVADFRRHGSARVHRALAAYRSLVRRLREEDARSSDNRAALALRGLVLLADHTASAHVPPARSALTRVDDTAERLGLGSFDSLYPHQREAAGVCGHALLTAPTGSGKTEAALLWAARQQEEHPGRVFYLLPYQASLNAMADRLSTIFPGCVALQHSRSLQALYRRLLDKPYEPRAAAAVARREHALARLHHHPVRVLTPYQLLRGAFRLKGYEALLTDAVDGAFVFDEIHAYEPRRFGMILGMIEYITRCFGGRLLVMSATLPRMLRDELTKVLGSVSAINAGSALYRTFSRHTLRLLQGSIADAPVVAGIAERAASGESVLVVCNTVRRARAVHERLRDSVVGIALVELLHGRFNARDRVSKEQRLLQTMGTQSRDRCGASTILVATQVVEVSLDLDFDTVYTEPAPLESLVQRFGRVNRGRRRHSCDVHVLLEPGAGRDVYEDRYVASAIKILGERGNEMLDEAEVGSWLDQVYAGPIAEEWKDQMLTSRDEFRAACLADLRAFQSSPDLAEAFDRMFDGTEVLPWNLVDEYDELDDVEPLRSSELLVPISSAQLAWLRRAGRARRGDDGLTVVHVTYDSERGLDL